MSKLVFLMFREMVLKIFLFEVFGPIRGGRFLMVFGGFGEGGSVSQALGRSVRRSVGWSVGRSVGQALGRSVGSPSTPSPSPPPVTKEVFSDIASSVWELCLVWRRLNMG